MKFSPKRDLKRNSNTDSMEKDLSSKYSIVLHNEKVNRIIEESPMRFFDCCESRKIRFKVATPRKTISRNNFYHPL